MTCPPILEADTLLAHLGKRSDKGLIAVRDDVPLTWSCNRSAQLKVTVSSATSSPVQRKVIVPVALLLSQANHSAPVSPRVRGQDASALSSQCMMPATFAVALLIRSYLAATSAEPSSLSAR